MLPLFQKIKSKVLNHLPGGFVHVTYPHKFLVSGQAEGCFAQGPGILRQCAILVSKQTLTHLPACFEFLLRLPRPSSVEALLSYSHGGAANA